MRDTASRDGGDAEHAVQLGSFPGFGRGKTAATQSPALPRRLLDVGRPDGVPGTPLAWSRRMDGDGSRVRANLRTVAARLAKYCWDMGESPAPGLSRRRDSRRWAAACLRAGSAGGGDAPVIGAAAPPHVADAPVGATRPGRAVAMALGLRTAGPRHVAGVDTRAPGLGHGGPGARAAMEGA